MYTLCVILGVGAAVLLVFACFLVHSLQIRSRENAELKKHIECFNLCMSSFWSLIAVLEETGLGFVFRDLPRGSGADYCRLGRVVSVLPSTLPGEAFLVVEWQADQYWEKYRLCAWIEAVKSQIDPQFLRTQTLEHFLEEEMEKRSPGGLSFETGGTFNISQTVDEILAIVKFYERGWKKIQPLIKDRNELILDEHARQENTRFVLAETEKDLRTAIVI